MADLESRSGHKTLLKLLLSKTNDVLTQSESNQKSIELLEYQSKELEKKLLLIIKHLEIVTGEENDDY